MLYWLARQGSRLQIKNSNSRSISLQSLVLPSLSVIICRPLLLSSHSRRPSHQQTPSCVFLCVKPLVAKGSRVFLQLALSENIAT